VDATIIAIVQFYHPAWLTLFMQAMSSMGSLTAYLVLVPLVAGILALRGKRRLALATLTVMTGNILTPFLKDIIHRSRPDVSVAAISTLAEGFSFPSGHAFAATIFYGFLAYLAFRFRKRWPGILCVALVFLIGVSRIYLGVHWPSDVLAGWLLGLAWLAAFIWITRGRRLLE
jgi:undecaprenyl-diphosphatase